MAVAYRSSATASDVLSTTPSSSTPAGATTGDVLFWRCVVESDSVTITIPSGFTLIGEAATVGLASAGIKQAVAYKVLTGAPAGSYAGTLSVAQAWTCDMIAISGAYQSDPIYSAGGTYLIPSTATATVETPSTTTAINGSLVLAYGAIAIGATWTPPTGMTEAFEVEAFSIVDASAAYVVQAAAGNTGAKSFTVAASTDPRVSFIVVVSPSAAPNTPTWVSPASGQPADVAAALSLDWAFSDPNTGDTQSKWAMSRQIGAGTLAYFRDSDDTWQATEQQNTSAATALTLASGWGADSDASHTYKVKTWDADGNASAYSAALVVVPSAKDNPTIATPADAGTVVSALVTVTWSAATQTAYRARLLTSADVQLEDSGWVTSTATSKTFSRVSTNGESLKVEVTTKNDEGLQSTADTNSFTVAFTPPPAPALTVTANSPTGAIGLSWLTHLNLLTANQASLETDTTGWQALVNSTISRTTVQAAHGVASLRMTSVAAGDMSAGTPSGTSGVAVSPNTVYTAHASIRRSVATSRACHIAILWYKSDGSVSAVSAVASGFSKDVTNAAWVQVTVTATSPSDAAFARVRPYCAATAAAAETIDVDKIALVAGRVNLLSEDHASAETVGVGASNWSSFDAEGTITRSSEHAHHGDYSLRLAASVSVANILYALPSTAYPAAVGETYTLVAAFRAATAPRTSFVRLQFRDASASLSSTDGTAVLNTIDGWTFATVSAVAPSGTLYVRPIIGINDVVAGEVHYADAIAVIPGTPAATAFVLDNWSEGGLTLTHDVYRRETGDTGDGIRIAAAAGASFTDWAVTSGGAYSYRIKAMTSGSATAYTGWTT